MFVKLLSGPRAGQEVEMKYQDAKALLNDGRAVLAFPPDPPAATAAAVATGTALKKKKHK